MRLPSSDEIKGKESRTLYRRALASATVLKEIPILRQLAARCSRGASGEFALNLFGR